MTRKVTLWLTLSAMLLAVLGCSQTFILERDPEKAIVQWKTIIQTSKQWYPVEVQVPVEVDNTSDADKKDPNAIGHTVTDINNPEPTEPAPPAPPKKVQRPILYLISTDYPGGEIKPDSIMISGRQVREGTPLPPGNYSFQIKKSGYNPLSGNFVIDNTPGNYTLRRQMIAKQRPLKINVINANTKKALTPNKILLGARTIRSGAMVKPGPTTLEIHLAGYQSVVDDNLLIPVGEGEYSITRMMIPAEVQLRFKFTDAQTGKSVKPDRILLNKKLTTDGSYAKAGKYGLEVYKRGYEGYQTSVTIPNKANHTITGKLNQSRITFEWEITGDYPEEEYVEPEEVLIGNKSISAGDYVSPGEHTVTVRHSNYQELRKRVRIPRGTSNYTFKGVLVSLPRLIELSVAHDISPTEALPNYEVSLKNVFTGAVRQVRGGEKMKPAQYEVYVKQRAYTDYRGTVRIFPGQAPYKIEAKLQAKPRVVNVDVSFDINPPSDLAPHVVQFVDSNKIPRSVRPGGTIKPGSYRYKVLKPGYTMEGTERTEFLAPSEEPFLIRATMLAAPRKISLDAVMDNVLIDPQEVLIDGKPYGYSPIRPGTYQINVRFKDFQTVSKQITILPGVGPHVEPLDLERK